MYPELFKLGPFTVYSYGLMLAVSFIAAGYILALEFKRQKIADSFASEITLLAIIFGIIGGKMFHVLENLNDLNTEGWSMIFSPGGLTYYGGFLLATAAIAVYIRKKKLGFLLITDLASPSLAIAYGIGRIGCHLAGDGDYGIPTSLPWGVNYEKGIVPPSSMFRGSEIAASFPDGIVPDNTPLHPTPVYEFLIALVIFFILFYAAKKYIGSGKRFMLYLILTGAARFGVEFLRLNPPFLFSMTQAQFISVILIIIGAGGFFYLKNPPKEAAK